MLDKLKQYTKYTSWVLVAVMAVYIIATTPYINTVTLDDTFVIEFKNPLSK